MIWFIQYRIRLRKCRNCHFVRPIWPNFAFISKTIIPHFLLVCIFDLLSSFWIQRYAITPCSDGDIALMPKLCEKYAIFGWFFMIFGTFRAHIWPHILSRHHINDYFIFWTLNRVCSNDKFDSMHGWYGFNAQIMWKICHFWVIFYDFWDL